MKFSTNVILIVASCAALLVVANAADDSTTTTTSSSENQLRGGAGSSRRRTQEEDDYANVHPFSPHHLEEEDGSKHDDEYIVVYRNKPTDEETAQSFSAFTATVLSSYEETSTMKTYSNILHGATMKLSPSALEYMEHHPDVELVEKNIPINAYSTEITQTGDNLPWGLDRIDQFKGTDGSYTYGEEFRGSTVHAYVIDTGIRSTHQEFEGRLGNGYNARQGDTGHGPQVWEDCNGHGTHVASTLGGTNYGVAKQVTLHAVRVLNCGGGGTLSDVLEGMDWVARQHQNNPGQKSVVNMSIGGGRSFALNNAAARMVSRGIFVAVAAGNSNWFACNESPASANNVVTVAATDRADQRAWYSNYGQCVDVFAPGNNILGAFSSCNECTITISGTSMASPHVAGVGALLMDGGITNPNDIRNFILASAGTGLVSNTNGSPNAFLQAP